MRLMRGKGRDGRNILLGKSAATVFDCLLAVSPGQDDDRVELGVVQLVHRVGGDVQQGVLALIHDVPDGGEPHYRGLAALSGTVKL